MAERQVQSAARIFSSWAPIGVVFVIVLGVFNAE
jgi:p-aminobenzoyl-glutamate transporter AbgT